MAVIAKFRDGNSVLETSLVRFRTGGVTYTVAGSKYRRPGTFTLGWETDGEWTSLSVEEQFWGWLRESPNTATVTLGQTLQGRPLRAAIYGNPADPAFLLVGGLHGSEAAGREAALMILRDAVTGAHDDVLSGKCLVVMPTANPDGRANNTRTNTQGLDINRDMWKLETAEATAITTLIRDYEPLMLADLHQYAGDGVHHFWPQSNPRPNTVAGLQTLADDARDAALVAVDAAGFISTPYPLSRRGTLNESATFHHCVGLLAESRARDYERADVLQVHQVAVRTWLEFFADNVAALETARAASISAALNDPGPEVVNLINVDIRPANTYTINIAGYDLLEPLQQKYVALFGIDIQGTFVPINQRARGVLPEILDPESLYKVADATRRV